MLLPEVQLRFSAAVLVMKKTTFCLPPFRSDEKHVRNVEPMVILAVSCSAWSHCLETVYGYGVMVRLVVRAFIEHSDMFSAAILLGLLKRLLIIVTR